MIGWRRTFTQVCRIPEEKGKVQQEKKNNKQKIEGHIFLVAVPAGNQCIQFVGSLAEAARK